MSTPRRRWAVLALSPLLLLAGRVRRLERRGGIGIDEYVNDRIDGHVGVCYQRTS